MGAKSIFCAVPDIGPITPHGDALIRRAAMKLVEDAQIPWRNSAAVPWQLPGVLSWHYVLALSLKAPLSSFAPHWKPFPSGRLMLWWGVSPVAALPSVPPPATTTRRHHHFGMGFLSAPKGPVFPLITAAWSKHLSWWDASTLKPCPAMGQPSVLPS